MRIHINKGVIKALAECFMANRQGYDGNRDTLSSGPKSLQMGSTAVTLKDACSLEMKLRRT